MAESGRVPGLRRAGTYLYIHVRQRWATHVFSLPAKWGASKFPFCRNTVERKVVLKDTATRRRVGTKRRMCKNGSGSR